MLHRFIVITTLLIYSILVTGCMMPLRKSFIREELVIDSNVMISEVTLDTGEIIRFGEAGGHFSRIDNEQASKIKIVGATENDKTIEVDLEHVLGAKTEEPKMSDGLIALYILGIPVAIGATLALVYFLFLSVVMHDV